MYIPGLRLASDRKSIRLNSSHVAISYAVFCLKKKKRVGGSPRQGRTGRNVAMSFPVTEHIAKSSRHTSFYLACGGAHRPALIFVHCFLDLSASCRHQPPCLPDAGFI